MEEGAKESAADSSDGAEVHRFREWGSAAQILLLSLDGRMQNPWGRNAQCNNNHIWLSHRATEFFIFISWGRISLDCKVSIVNRIK